MRSLSSKLIIAFLAVSLISIGVIVALTHFSTNREFDKFISEQYQAERADEFARFYDEHGSWQGVQSLPPAPPGGPAGRDGVGRSFFYITDPNGRVVLESFQHKMGAIANPADIGSGTPIQVNRNVVGYLILETPPQTRDPRQDEFLRRLDSSLFLTAIGTILFALLFGVILSRNITSPIRELTAATQAVAEGKLSQKVSVRSRDEIGTLAASFNKMSDDLARASDLRKQMTADIAHELRTPLSLIIGHAEAVNDGVLPASRENFEIIREEAGRLEQLVNDLRTLSLADAGELSVDRQLVDINKLLADIQTHYRHQFNRKQIKLEFVAGSGDLMARLDSARCSQVITNILDNALYYTPQGGRVVIGSRRLENNVEITIQDSGGGVSPDEAARLFDRFYRADPSRTREDGGSGLGLAIAKSIIEMHKGRIWAESEKGDGLRVVIVLPLAD